MQRRPDLSKQGIADTFVWAGPSSNDGPTTDVLIELPHGATRRSDYDAVRARLKGDFPAELERFFFVNTDVGSPECGVALAEQLCRHPAIGRVAVIRSLLPRTFIDCNRTAQAVSVTHAEALAAEQSGKQKPMTPMLPEYVRDAEDRAWLLELHGSYQELVLKAYQEFCGERGWAVMLHTYAPRSVGIHVIDDGIVEALREAYRPGIYESWALRPEVDLIAQDEESRLLIDPQFAAAAIDAYRQIGVEATRDGTYRLNPTTTGYHHAVRHLPRTAVVEIRRDLLADPFDPFCEMKISPEKAHAMAAPLADALLASIG